MLPEWFKKGKTYFLKMSSTLMLQLPTGLYNQVAKMKNGKQVNHLLGHENKITQYRGQMVHICTTG
jgi:hypothetical protein